MASRYWVGGSATWDATAGSKWSATSGGAGGASVPTAADDVFFSNLSTGTCTLSAASVCRSLNCTGFTGTLSHPAAITLPIGDGTAGAGNIALKLSTGMTYALGNADTSILSFISTAATQQSITIENKVIGALTINAPGGSYQLQSDITASGCVFTVTAGSLDTNSKTLTLRRFVVTGTATRSVSLGASVISLTSGAQGNGVFDATTITNLTFNAGTSQITASGGNQIFRGGGLTFYDVILRGGGGSLELFGANTFHDLTFASSNSSRNSLDNDQVVTGTLNATMGSGSNMGFVRSNVIGAQRTITANAVSLTGISFADINGAGAAAPFATSGVGDMGGNSNITFDAPKTRFWVGNTGSFSDTSKWSTSSGGGGGASQPLCHDTAVFDANSFTSAGRVLTINNECIPTIDSSNVLNAPTFNFSITNGSIFLNGDLNLPTGTLTAVGGSSSLQLAHRSGGTILTGGHSLNNLTCLTLSPAFYSLVDNLNIANTLAVLNGGFDANDFNVTVFNFTSSLSATRHIKMGNGVWEMTGTGVCFNIQTNSGLTFEAEGSNLYFSNTSATAKTISRHAGSILNTITLAGGSGAFIFANANASYTEKLIVNAPAIVTFNAPATYSFGSWDVVGTPGNLITISSNNTTNHTISVAWGYIDANYISISRSTAQGGAAFYAGPNSTNGGNNTGWLFVGAPIFNAPVIGATMATPGAGTEVHQTASIDADLLTALVGLYGPDIYAQCNQPIDVYDLALFAELLAAEAAAQQQTGTTPTAFALSALLQNASIETNWNAAADPSVFQSSAQLQSPTVETQLFVSVLADLISAGVSLIPATISLMTLGRPLYSSRDRLFTGRTSPFRKG